MPRRTPLEVFINAQTDRQAAYEKRKRAAGFTKVNLWVPVECVDRIKELARAMVDEKEKAQAEANADAA